MSDVDIKEQSKVARTVLICGGGAIALLLVMAGVSEIILVFKMKDMTDGNRDMYAYIEKLLNGILNSTIPLVGVWVGAIISYYFGKANFEAASKSMKDAYNAANPATESLSDKTISGCMVKFSDKMLSINTAMTAKEALDYIEAYNKANPDIFRVPVLKGNTRIPVGYFEKEDIKRAVTEKGDEKIEAILEKNGLSRTSFRLISVRKTMKDASVYMSDPGVCILYVTENGSKEEDLQGIITSKDIAKCLL